MEQEPKTFHSVAPSLLVVLNTSFQRKTKSEMQLVWGRASSSPGNIPGVSGRVGNTGKKDPKSQQGNFRWQEAKV